MNSITGCIAGIFLVGTCFADTHPVAPADINKLVKVTKESNPKCVEYVNYKNEMYCTLEPLDTKKSDADIMSYETQKIKFDSRPWRAAWGQQSDTISMVEYVPMGDDINNWQELVTSQFMPKLGHVSTTQFAKFFLENIKKSGAVFTVQQIDKQPDQLIFEYKIQKPTNLQQDEILKMVQRKEGMYVLHYVIKQPDMSPENRKKWIENIKNSSIKK